jgi:hypothetical protein
MFAAGSAYAWSYEGLLWSLSALLVVRALKTGNGRIWWLVGVAWGLNLLNKPTALLFVMGVGFGLLVTRSRVELLRKGYWLALTVAFVLSSPIWLWQTAHGWPIFKTISGMSTDEYVDSEFWLGYFSRGKMILAQPALVGPFGFILAAVGVFYCLAFSRESAWRVFVWACAAVAVAYVVTSGHPGYPSPLYALFIASGCVAAARITAGKKVRWMRPLLMAGLAVQGLAITPLCVSVLPPDLLDGYSRLVCRGVLAPLSGTAVILQGRDAAQYEMGARTLGKVRDELSADDRKNCCIILGWSTVAAGVEFYGPKYHLPDVYCPHLNQSAWGPPGENTGPVIATAFNRKDLEDWFGSVEYVGRFEGDRTPGIFLCRSPKGSYRQIWREMCGKSWAFRWKVEKYIGNGEDPRLPTSTCLDLGRRMA